MPAIVTSVPFAVAIFLLLGQGEYVKFLEESAICSVAFVYNMQKS